MTISGDNFQPVKAEPEAIFFQICTHLGWATWRRAWQKYDLTKWPEFRERGELLRIMNQSTAKRAEEMLNATFNGKTFAHFGHTMGFRLLAHHRSLHHAPSIW